MLADLVVTPLAEILRRLSSARRSGDLQVRAERVAKTLYFDHGRLVFAASNLKQDRLGEALMALGRITPAEFAEASALMRGPTVCRRFGEALERAGVLDRNEIGHAVARQVQRIALSLFELDDAAASFEERPCPVPVEYMVSLSLHRLLYLGVGGMRSEALIRTGLGDVDRVVRPASVAPFRFSIQRCSDDELDLLERCRDGVRLGVLLAEAPTLKRLRAAYALLASGIIEWQTATQEPVLQPDGARFMLSPAQRRPQRASASVARVPSAARATRAATSAATAGTAQPPAATADAPAVDRRRGRESQVTTPEPTTSAVPGGESQPARGGTHGPAPAVRADAKSGTPAAAPESAPPRRVSEPVAAQAPVPGGPPGDRETEPPAAPRPPTAGPSPTATADEDPEIRNLASQAEMHMMISDYRRAAVCYAKIVEREPRVARHHLRLAAAMALHPPTAKHAEREFYEAVRLAPNEAEIHFQFGLYYRAMRQRGRAREQFRLALALDPRHRRARGELEALSPNDDALRGLGWLLRAPGARP